MNRLMILAAATTAFGVGKLSTELANPPVDLQPTSPGTQQIGHINVSGTILGSKIIAQTSGPTTGAVAGYATSPTGFVFGGDFRSSSTDGRGLFASATAATGSTYGGDFRSASASGRGIFGYATSPSGQGIGGDFRSDSPAGKGIVARTTGSTGSSVAGQFSTASTTGIGIQATSTATTGATYGALVDSYSSSGTGATGYFRTNGATGAVVALSAKVTASNNLTAKAVKGDGRSGYGGYFEALGEVGLGMAAYGMQAGVYGLSDVATGVTGESNSSSGKGVSGYVPGGGTGVAIYADGILAASGTKTMRIDHPNDPENKYLIQFCAEGDTPQLQYRGMAKLDSKGEATVQLPTYFNKINRDPTYQLTAMGVSMPGLFIAQPEQNNLFKIGGGLPGAQVSWLVIGIRNDRYVQRYGAEAEVAKPDSYRGTYLQPELYGKARQEKEGYSVKTDSALNRDPAVASETVRSTKTARQR